MTGAQVLRSTRSILLVDFPSIEVPTVLTHAGFVVMAHVGRGPQDYSRYELDGSEVREVSTGQAPDRVDLVYVHRPLGELSAIFAQARDLNATAVWFENGSEKARAEVEGADLVYVDQPSIVEAARDVSEGR